MPNPITVPRLGWSMDEGTFVGWLKQEGEPVQAGEPLFALEGDKAAQEVEATESGLLRILPTGPRPGEPVSVGTLLGHLVAPEEAGASAPATPTPAATPEEASGIPSPAKSIPNVALPARPEPAKASGPAASITISPRARRRAAELGLDWSHLRGSGRTGRIREADVARAAAQMASAGSTAMRRTIAQRTTESYARAPHFYVSTEVDATQLLAFRERILPEVQQATGIRLTLTDLLLRAQALALQECPGANAIWQNERVVRLPACDVGLVVGLDDGLLIPIIRAANTGSLAALAKQRCALVEAARARRLTAEALQGGATSLSNLGRSCVDEFGAVIAPPQSSMLAVGRVAPRPLAVHHEVVARPTLKLCLSVDHRVMDGGAAAQFLGRMVALLEHAPRLAAEAKVDEAGHPTPCPSQAPRRGTGG